MFVCFSGHFFHTISLILKKTEGVALDWRSGRDPPHTLAESLQGSFVFAQPIIIIIFYYFAKAIISLFLEKKPKQNKKTLHLTPPHFFSLPVDFISAINKRKNSQTSI